MGQLLSVVLMLLGIVLAVFFRLTPSAAPRMPEAVSNIPISAASELP